jgi:RNA polymerase sigma-70 factor (ECF subfamily)
LANSPGDAELLRLMAEGDEDAFAMLYRRRQGGVYRFALQMCGSAEIAEDVTQEVFMALMQDCGNYDASRGSLAAYLYGIARNHVLRLLQRDRAYVPIHDESDEDGARGGGGSIHEGLISPCDLLADLTRGETIERVRQAVLALPAHYREVVVLCELHEMSYVEAAGVVGCAVGTVRSRLHRARAMLTEKLRATVEASGEAGETGKAEEGFSSSRTARCFA